MTGNGSTAMAVTVITEGALIDTATILVVEDNAAVTEMVSGGLRGQGFRTLPAANGMEALHLAERHTGKIDALITGVDLAEFDGIELALLVKTARPQLKVLFLAGDIPGERDAAEAMVPGSLFLEKPFGVDRIARGLRQALDQRTDCSKCEDKKTAMSRSSLIATMLPPKGARRRITMEHSRPERLAF